MLLTTYSTKHSKLKDLSKGLSEIQKKLLLKIRSKGRFDRLMEVLPEDWEKTFKINFFDDPSDVARAFINERHYRNTETIYENAILTVIINKQLKTDPETGESHLKYPAVPARYDEYLKRDYDYPVEENKWKTNLDLTESIPGSFHLDHKLIWTSKFRKLPEGSTDKIDTIPYTYSINVYVPSEQTLVEVANLMQNGIE